MLKYPTKKAYVPDTIVLNGAKLRKTPVPMFPPIAYEDDENMPPDVTLIKVRKLLN